MKKKLSTLALAALATLAGAPALAQVNLSGVIDINYDISRSESGKRQTMGSGGLSTSRVQIKSVEDLGQGLSVTGVHEIGFRANSGELGSARHSYVQLASKRWGEFSMGRRDLPSAEMYGYIDPTFSGDYSPISNTLLYFAPWRESNGFFYTTPRIGNVQGRIATTLGRGDGSKDARVTSVAVDYWGGDLYLMAALDQQYRREIGNPSNMRRSRDAYLGGVYSMGSLDLTFLYHRYSGYYAYPPYVGFASKGHDVQIGARYEIDAKNKVFASLVRKSDALDDDLSDATSWVVGYQHVLSKRTDVYGVIGAVNHARDSDLRFPVSFNHPTPQSGDNPRGVQVGIRHKF